MRRLEASNRSRNGSISAGLDNVKALASNWVAMLTSDCNSARRR